VTNRMRAPVPSVHAASVRLSQDDVEHVPAVLHIAAASARVTVNNQPAGLIDVHDPSIWVSIDHWLIERGEVLVATVPPPTNASCTPRSTAPTRSLG
jgi:hypothetical protein